VCVCVCVRVIRRRSLSAHSLDRKMALEKATAWAPADTIENVIGPGHCHVTPTPPHIVRARSPSIAHSRSKRACGRGIYRQISLLTIGLSFPSARTQNDRQGVTDDLSTVWARAETKTGNSHLSADSSNTSLTAPLLIRLEAVEASHRTVLAPSFPDDKVGTGDRMLLLLRFVTPQRSETRWRFPLPDQSKKYPTAQQPKAGKRESTASSAQTHSRKGPCWLLSSPKRPTWLPIPAVLVGAGEGPDIPGSPISILIAPLRHVCL
jgi:hypothetical protein